MQQTERLDKTACRGPGPASVGNGLVAFREIRQSKRRERKQALTRRSLYESLVTQIVAEEREKANVHEEEPL